MALHTLFRYIIRFLLSPALMEDDLGGALGNPLADARRPPPPLHPLPRNENGGFQEGMAAEVGTLV